ncbi:MAG TPA: sugar ABC transporter substrate-binding protein [Candidatus Macondimonas sp.]|nr:sugar ABC transporter substrate-binding protein [Candidatus Macondimonas sp.]
MRRPWIRGVLAASLFLFGLGLAQQQVTLNVIGFRVPPNEVGTPLDKAYQEFIRQFEAANPGVKVNALETPPDFDTYILTALASGTAPDVWSQDGSSLAKVAASGQLLDMERCRQAVPSFNFSRFFPNVLALHQGLEKGKTYGVPNDFTPMVMYYNPEAFKKAGVPLPTKENLTWDEFLNLTRRLTLDKNGKNALDPAFDRNNIEQYGFRVRKFPFEWVYWLWGNGGDVISPDGKTASGYLDSPASIEAITFLRDLMLRYYVSPTPSALDALQANVGFLDLFLQGKVAIFPRGHWELVGLRSNKNYQPGRVAVMGNPYKLRPATVIYESGFVIPANIRPEKLTAACKFIEAATSPAYQNTKVLTGIAISGNQSVAANAISKAPQPAVERAFFNQVRYARAPYGARYAAYPAVETVLESMMERILAGGDVKTEVAKAVQEINRELSRGR